MTIEIAKEARQEAVQSIERWFLDARDEKIGHSAAAALLGFFVVDGRALCNVDAMLHAHVVRSQLKKRLIPVTILWLLRHDRSQFRCGHLAALQRRRSGRLILCRRLLSPDR